MCAGVCHFGSSHFAQTSVAHAQGEVHSGVVVFVCTVASPSAVPWCARDGLRWTFPSGGSRLCAGHEWEKWPHSKQVGSGSAQNGPAGRWRSSHVRQGVPTARVPDPDVVQEAANQRVIKLEAALRAMGDCDGPEVATLKSSLQKARVASRSKPIQDQIVETEAFISRAKKRLSVLEEERVREQELLDKALLRQERLRRDLEIEREEQACAVPDVSAQLHRLEVTLQNSGRNETICSRKWRGDAVCGWRTNLQMWSVCHPSHVRSSTFTIGEFQELRTSQCFGVRRSQDSLHVVFSVSRGMRKVGSSWHHRVHGHQFTVRFRREAPLSSWEGCTSFHGWER